MAALGIIKKSDILTGYTGVMCTEPFEDIYSCVRERWRWLGGGQKTTVIRPVVTTDTPSPDTIFSL